MIALLTPSEGECADLQTAQQRAFLAMEKRPYDVDKIDWSTPTWTQAPDGTKPAPVVFSWSGTGAVPARFALSEFADFRQKYTMNTTEQTLAVYNLLPGKRYYWRINDSPIGSFTTGSSPAAVTFSSTCSVSDTISFFPQPENIIATIPNTAAACFNLFILTSNPPYCVILFMPLK